ncbi:DNA repair protein rad2, partial [Linderina macrospora]
MGNYESHSEGGGSDMEANANLLAMYGDYGQLEELHRKREEEMRHQREQEEFAIVAMNVQEFLSIWMNLATPAMLDADPFIRVNMQRWLLEERLDSLRVVAHRAARQFEKQPELDAEEPVLDSSVMDVDAYEEMQQLRVRVSTLALLSNYLSFAVKWREAREAVAEPEAVSDSEEPEPIALESSSLLTASDLPRGMAQFADEPEPETESVHDHQRNHDTVFAKAELLAQENADAPQPKKHRPTAIVVHSIDSDGSDGSDDDIMDDPVGVTSESKPAEDTAMDQEEQHDDDDDDEAVAVLMRNEQDEYAHFVTKLKQSVDPANQPKRGNYEGMRAELERELASLRARVRDSRRDASAMDSDMVEDVRMLLTMFGVPYITAPMEAEAQCARLVELQL